MEITESDIMTYRMMVCSECKRENDNFYGGEFCRGYDIDIMECIRENYEAYAWGEFEQYETFIN